METLENQDAENAMISIQNNYEGSNNNGPNGGVNNGEGGAVNNFNPIDKLMEAFEEIKQLNEEHKALYERMLKEKDEMIARLLKDK